jgi:hypothetical protein
MSLIKYGCVLSSANKAGTDLNIEAFADNLGNTTTVVVEPGDLVLEAAIDPITSALTGTVWMVFDGAPWVDETPNGQIAGTFLVATAPDLPYQQGSLIVFLDNNGFTSVNLSQTQVVAQAIVDASIGGP